MYCYSNNYVESAWYKFSKSYCVSESRVLSRLGRLGEGVLSRLSRSGFGGRDAVTSWSFGGGGATW